MSRCARCGTDLTGAFCTMCGAAAPASPASGQYGSVPSASGQYGTVPSASGPYGSVPPASGPYGSVPPASGPYGTVPPATASPVPAPPVPAPPVPPGPPSAVTGPQTYGALPAATPYPSAQQAPGQPYVPQAPRRGPGLPVLAAVLALAVLLVGFLVAQRQLVGTAVAPTPTIPTPVAPTRTTASGPVTLQPIPPAGPTTKTPSAPPPVVTVPVVTANADEMLQLTAAASRSQLDAAVASHAWVAQLASKYVGITDPLQTTASGSHTFGAADIMAEHLALVARGSDATVILADSRTYGSGSTMEGRPYWRTMALSPSFSEALVVTVWCARTFPELSGDALNNQCLPVQL